MIIKIVTGLLYLLQGILERNILHSSFHHVYSIATFHSTVQLLKLDTHHKRCVQQYYNVLCCFESVVSDCINIKYILNVLLYKFSKFWDWLARFFETLWTVFKCSFLVLFWSSCVILHGYKTYFSFVVTTTLSWLEFDTIWPLF